MYRIIHVATIFLSDLFIFAIIHTTNDIADWGEGTVN